MNASKDRRNWNARRKLEIVLESLQSDQKVAELCRREGLSPNLVYLWRRQLMGSAETIFTRKKPTREDPKLVKLEADNRRMKDVIAEITAENLTLKKTLSD